MEILSKLDEGESGIFIPISEWNKIKEKYIGIEDELNKSVLKLTKAQNDAIDLALSSVKQNKIMKNDEVMVLTKERYSKLFNDK